MKLCLGVIDHPYVQFEAGKPVKGKSKKAGTQTTGDVAEWLEEKYHVMRIFYELHGQKIADEVGEEMKGQFENMLAGGPRRNSIALDGAMSKIEKMFRKFIDSREIETIGYPGIPTKAALMGINHRFKNPDTGKRRPSFSDTGQYEQAFKSFTKK